MSDASTPTDPSDPPSGLRSCVGAFVSGVVAAMAMSGLRNLTVSLDLLEEIPPREIIDTSAPPAVRRIGENRERALAEIAHWTFGGVCGVVYGELLRRRPRRSKLRAAVFGGAVLGLYRVAIAPALGIGTSRTNTVVDQVMLAADHVLFGLVLDDLLHDPS